MFLIYPMIIFLKNLCTKKPYWGFFVKLFLNSASYCLKSCILLHFCSAKPCVFGNFLDCHPPSSQHTGRCTISFIASSESSMTVRLS